MSYNCDSWRPSDDSYVYPLEDTPIDIKPAEPEPKLGFMEKIIAGTVLGVLLV